MPPAGKILVVDNTPDQLQFLTEIIERALPGWSIVPAIDEKQAREFLADGRQVEDLKIAVVDLYLTKPRREPGEGLRFLGEIEKKAPGCFRILVSAQVKKPPAVARDDPRIQYFVSLKWVDSEPALELRTALSEAEKAIRQQEQHSCSRG
jgi:hypothetical protein